MIVKIYPTREKALDNVQKELKREINLDSENVFKSYKNDYYSQEGRKRDISYIEMVVNNLRTQIVRFLWKISAQHTLDTTFEKGFCFYGNSRRY